MRFLLLFLLTGYVFARECSLYNNDLTYNVTDLEGNERIVDYELFEGLQIVDFPKDGLVEFNMFSWDYGSRLFGDGLEFTMLAEMIPRPRPCKNNFRVGCGGTRSAYEMGVFRHVNDLDTWKNEKPIKHVIVGAGVLSKTEKTHKYTSTQNYVMSVRVEDLVDATRSVGAEGKFFQLYINTEKDLILLPLIAHFAPGAPPSLVQTISKMLPSRKRKRSSE